MKPCCIVAIVLALALAFVGYATKDVAEERDTKLDKYRDSLSWTKARADSSKALADIISATLDSMRAAQRPQTIVIQEALDFARSADLNVIRDSLMTP